MPRALLGLLLCCLTPLIPAHAQVTLEVGYLPILPVAQLFVIQGEGWAGENNLELRLHTYNDEPPIAQALRAGELDAAYMGINAAMETRNQGVALKVVAAAVKDHVGVVVRGELGRLATQMPMDDAIAAFAREQGRRPVFAALPEQSVPNTVLRFWLSQRLLLDPAAVEIRAMDPSVLLRSVLVGEVDAAGAVEPMLTVVQAEGGDARVLTWGAQLLSNHPGIVLVVTEDLLENHASVVENLVRLHIRATDLLVREPQRVVPHVQQFLGDRSVSAERIAEALRSPFLNYLSDPRRISASTVVMHDFRLVEGTLEEPVELADLFEFSVYQAATRSGR